MCIGFNSNSNWTFIALNLPNTKGTKATKQKQATNLNIQGQKNVQHHGEHKGE